jgi:uncharacterized protein (DUF433 family)
MGSTGPGGAVMSLEGTVQNGVIVPDADAPPLPDGTRVEFTPRTGMEPAICKTPDVMGGSACVRRTRIAVWVLVGYRRLGLTDEALLDAYPDLTRPDLVAAWAYYAAHPDEIDRDIRENESDDGDD